MNLNHEILSRKTDFIVTESILLYLLRRSSVAKACRLDNLRETTEVKIIIDFMRELRAI